MIVGAVIGVFGVTTGAGNIWVEPINACIA